MDLEKIHELALKRYKKGKDALTEIHQLMEDDKKFKVGEQWPAGIPAERKEGGRPCLTMNAIPVFTSQVSNSNAMNSPRIRVVPVGEGADEETAKVINGKIRQIQNTSNSKNAYNTAFSDSVDVGLGGFTMDVDYVSDRSNKQDVFINRIRNNFTIIPDPNAIKLDFSDREWQFVDYCFDKDEFVEKYGEDRKPVNLDTLSDLAEDWYGETYRLAEYFYKSYTDDEVYTLPDGTETLKSEFDKEVEKIQVNDPEFIPPSPVFSRPTKKMTVMWGLMDGLGFIEKPRELLWKNIPVIILIGEEDDIRGKLYLQGKIRRLKDPQQELNFWTTAETEGVALFPKPKHIGPKGSFDSNKNKWDNANNDPTSTLEYDIVVGPDGVTPMPPPQFVTFNNSQIGAERLSMRSLDMMKFLSGISDPSLGLLSQERSGVAVKALQQKSDIGVYEYTEHEIVALEYAGNLLVDVIPKIWDTPDEIIQIMDEDGTIEKKQINRTQVKQNESPLQLNRGKYQVIIEVGADYHTKRQENREYLIQFAQAFPAFAELVPDLIAKDMDFNAAHEMVERFQMLLEQKYPGITQGKDGKINPAQFMAMVQQNRTLQQQIQQLTMQLQDKNQDRQLEKYKTDMSYQEEVLKVQGKAQSEQVKEQGDLIEQQMKSQADLLKSREKNRAELMKAQITRKVDIT